MKIISQNTTEFTPEIYNEGYKILWGANYYRSVKKLIIFLAAIVVLSVAFVMYQGLPLALLITEFLCIGVMALYILFIAPRQLKKRIYHRISSGSTGTSWRKYTFYETSVNVTHPDGTVETYQNSDILSVYEGKNIYLLYTNGKNNILIDKRKFTGDLPPIISSAN